MPSTDELIACPGGCENRVHQRATECPRCGYRAEVTGFDELLGSVSTICSILVGFGLAALVTLATDESRAFDDPAVQWTTGLWIFSSVLLLVVMVLAELIRRREIGASRIQVSATEEDQLWRRCERLLGAFAFALVATATGVVLLGFHFSVVHGVVGAVAAGFGALVVFWALR